MVVVQPAANHWHCNDSIVEGFATEGLGKCAGRHISYMLCRGPYQKEDKWGYAPEIAQGWRATGDHHDNFVSTMKQVNSVKGKSTWSGPYGWHYLDMMMIGGEGCKDQGTGGSSDKGIWNWTVPKHCPGQTDNEYRIEASLYVVVSSPMMIGTDLRLMTPIMKELLLNEEAIAINQDYEAVPGDAVQACSAPVPAPTPPVEVCSVSLEKQNSHSACVADSTFGCTNGTSKMWTDAGCRGIFTCNGVSHVTCDHNGGGYFECECAAAASNEVWVRKLSNGDFAVAMPNLGDTAAELSVCFDSIGWPHGVTARVRNVWTKKDLGSFSQRFTVRVESHDAMLLRFSSETRVSI